MSTERQVILLQRLNAYRACETAILTGAQSYAVEDKVFRRADLRAVQEYIKKLEAELAGLVVSDTGSVRKTMRSQKALFRRW
jgi:hypothetical protein